jgi:serine phosphatase RsbU (regulator of sigma subunit)
VNETVPSYKSIQRRETLATVAITCAGALVVFLYFNVISPLPEGQAAVRAVQWTDVVGVLLGVGITLGGAMVWSNRRDARIATWYERLRQGAPAAGVPPQVRRDLLNTPLRAVVVNVSGWMLVGTVASVAAGTFQYFVVFVGTGGILTSVPILFVADLLRRPAISLFFPEGRLSAVKAFRLPVLGRLLIVLLLVAVLPPAILVNLSYQRAKMLLTAPNPQTVLANLLILEIFILVVSILAGVAVAVFMTRTITGPLDQLQRAMKRVEESDFDVQVPVTSNDELGYLSEGLNEMAAGLRERERIKEAHRKVEQELAVAWRIQESFLPPGVPQVPGWQLAATLEPARQTSGDFYDFIPLPGGRLGLLVADVADKGTGAALFMALSRTLIRTYAVEHDRDPALALAAANRRILMDTQSDLFVTVFYGILDPASGALAYCNAGHNPAYLFGPPGDGPVQELSITGLPLGIFEDGGWTNRTAQVDPGGVLALYSDGLTEAMNEQEEFFGKERLLAALQASLDAHGAARPSAQDVQDAVVAAVRAFAGDAPPFDDMTLVVAVRPGAA